MQFRGRGACGKADERAEDSDVLHEAEMKGDKRSVHARLDYQSRPLSPGTPFKPKGVHRMDRPLLAEPSVSGRVRR